MTLPKLKLLVKIVCQRFKPVDRLNLGDIKLKTKNKT